MALTHKELTKHIRTRIAKAGIKCRCKMVLSCGSQIIQIDVPVYEAEFSEAEQRTISHIAKCNGLTFVRGHKIDPTGPMTNSKEFSFYL